MKVSYSKVVWLFLAGVSASSLRGGQQQQARRSMLGLDLDFSAFQAGDKITSLDVGVTVTAMKRAYKLGPLEAADAMVFDSENPT